MMKTSNMEGIITWNIFLVGFLTETLSIDVTGGMFESNGTTSVPKSIPSLVLDN